MVNEQSMQFLQTLTLEIARKEIKLPSFPDAVIQIRDALEQEDCDIEKVSDLASLETVLASRLLQSANSAFYNAGGQQISNLRAAGMRLGLNEVRNMAIAVAVEQIFMAKDHPSIADDLAMLWRRSIALSSVAYVLAERCSKVSPQLAFICGLLHEVGKLYILIKAVDFHEVTVDLDARSDDQGSWHPQVGRCIVEGWGFDDVIAETLEPAQGLDGLVAEEPVLLDVVFGAELLCAKGADEAIDFTDRSLARISLDEERLAELQPVIDERMQAMMQTLGG